MPTHHSESGKMPCPDQGLNYPFCNLGKYAQEIGATITTKDGQINPASGPLILSSGT
jgi:hypothetical protein